MSSEGPRKDLRASRVTGFSELAGAVVAVSGAIHKSGRSEVDVRRGAAAHGNKRE